MATAAIWGLTRHQQAVDRLEELVHRSPDRAKLESAITRIQLPFAAPIDITQDAAVEVLRNDLIQRIAEAKEEKDEFYRRSLDAAQDPQFRELGFQGQPRLSRKMLAIDEHIENLTTLSRAMDFAGIESAVERTRLKNSLELDVGRSVARMNLTLSFLPEHDKQVNVSESLKSELKKSTRVLSNVYLLTGIALVSYAITLFLGFLWISNPLRAVARGAARIANGDSDYRLGRVTPWRDEYFELTENFNRMADRFQESEDQLNAKVEERSRQLVRSERLADVGFLATGVAHEINSPLQSMLNAAESIQYRIYDHLDPDDDDTATITERLEMIKRESQRCGQITRRLLNFARNESQETRVDDLTRVIGEVLAMIKPMIKYSDRNIIFERTAPLMLEINASEMKQVALNLISNALQATEAGGTVKIQIEELTDWVIFSVADDGHGMTPENIVNLFEPFYTTKETGVGTGLGLSITHRIVLEHHGTIDPHSDGPGKGSTFLVRLPKKQPVKKAA